MNDLDKNLNTEAETEDSVSRVYEVGYHVVPTVTEDDVPSVSSAIKESIKEIKGIIISEDNPKSLELSYPMDHIVANKKTIFSTAYFGWIKFEIKPESILKIKDSLEKNENVLRFLIIKTIRETTLSNKLGVKTKQPTVVKKEKEKETTKEVVAETKDDNIVSEKKEVISEEEVDKAIEELVV